MTQPADARVGRCTTTHGTRRGFVPGLRDLAWALALLLVAAGAEGQAGAHAGETRDFGGITFVWCPPGSAVLGTALPAMAIAERVGGMAEWYADEGPVREAVFNEGFWLSQTPITVGDWVRIGRAAELAAPPGSRGSDRPVTGISIAEIETFIDAMEGAARGVYRLPTESEWEYACRAGSETLYPFGDDPKDLGDHAWYRGNMPESILQAAGAKQANAWGLRDMLGNAWEVCATPYGVGGTHEEPPSPENRVIRGGSVRSPAGFVRSGYRAGRTMTSGHPLVSFRLLREAGR